MNFYRPKRPKRSSTMILPRRRRNIKRGHPGGIENSIGRKYKTSRYKGVNVFQ